MADVHEKTQRRLVGWAANTKKGFFKDKMGPCVRYAREQGWITEGGSVSAAGKKEAEVVLHEGTLQKLSKWVDLPEGALKERSGLYVVYARKKKWITKSGNVSAAGKRAAAKA